MFKHHDVEDAVRAVMMGSRTLTSSYQIPPGYPSWGSIRGYFTSLIQTALVNALDVDRTIMSSAVATGRDVMAFEGAMLREYDFPFFILHRDFIKIIENTDLPSGTDIEEAPLPFKGFTLALPKGSFVIQTHHRIDASLITVCGIDFPNGEFGMSVSVVDHDDLQNMSRKGSVNYFSTTIRFEGGKVIDDVSQASARFAEYHAPYSLDVAAQATLDVGRFVLKVMMVMNAEPELVEPERVTNTRKAKRDRPAMDFRVPKQIGRRVTIGRPEGSGKSGDSAGTVITHWRRGHMRRQRYGEGRQQQKMIWIKPILVNGPEPLDG